MKVRRFICILLALLLSVMSFGVAEFYNLGDESSRHELYDGNTENPLRVLILGNSFIGTSQVVSNLSAIAKQNGKAITVKAFAFSFASIETFLVPQYEWDMSKMEFGRGYTEDEIIYSTVPEYSPAWLKEYDIVCVCGFFGGGFFYLKKLMSYAQGGGTKFVIFPAANNYRWDAALSHKLYSDAGYVGWYDIIHYLWDEQDFVFADLATDDGAEHTNERGGYAGAMAIYAYIYGELPKSPELFEDGKPYFPLSVIVDENVPFDPDNSESFQWDLESVNWESLEKEQQKLAAMRAAVQGFVIDGTLHYFGE
ncbi:MAG: hypothetical protein LBT21_01735 [Oscillospiraceae bacterium]|jgi:hypothetical protein|nr:hypothetical protein [Oscillospiraceae bacterium]